MIGWMPFPENIKAPHLPELGNLLFGNSRGNYPIEDRRQWEDVFWKYFEDYFDYHGYYMKEKEDPEHTTERGGYENDVFLIEPYFWGEDEEIAEKPNFVFKHTGIEVQWYKYPFRDAYCNEKVSLREADMMFKICAESMRKGIQK